MCYAIATHNASKYIDQYRFYFRVFKNNAEAGFYGLCIGGTAYIEEVGRLATTQFNHVHGGHCQSGAVYHATHITVQFYKVEVEFCCFHFRRIFFACITQGSYIRVTHQCIVINVHFAIHRDDLAVACFKQWIYFEHAAIKRYISIVKIGYKLHAIFKGIALQSQVERDLARLETLQPPTGKYPFFEYFFRSIMCHIFDIHTAFCAVHDHVLALAAIK